MPSEASFSAASAAIGVVFFALMGVTFFMDNVRDDLVRLLSAMRTNLLEQSAEGLVSIVLAEVKRHPELHRRYHEVVIERRREAMRAVLRRGVAAGELRADLPIEIMKDLFSAPLLIRKIMHDAELPEELPEQVVDAVPCDVAAP